MVLNVNHINHPINFSPNMFVERIRFELRNQESINEKDLSAAIVVISIICIIFFFQRVFGRMLMPEGVTS